MTNEQHHQLIAEAPALETSGNIVTAPSVSDNNMSTSEYEKLSLYRDDNDFKFNVEEQPTIQDFEANIGEQMIIVAECLLNTNEHFPGNRSREYIDNENPMYDGKKVDYLQIDDRFTDNNCEWIYCIAYNGHIVKIGMTITSIKKRCGSYSCGTTRAMRKGSCSTTNYILTECNYLAITKGIKVQIFGIPCPIERAEKTRFGITRICNYSIAREMESMITDKFVNVYLHKPVLCVQHN